MNGPRDVGEVEPLVSWLTLTDWHEVTAVLDSLSDWLARVYLRYPDAQLPACWAWHPHVVEELCWLHQAWLDAYSGQGACWAAVATWHDRHRPGVAKRIAAATGTCGLELHATSPAEPTPAVPLPDALPHIAAAWATFDRRSWPPAPTASQLEQARQHHDDLAERRRTHRLGA